MQTREKSFRANKGFTMFVPTQSVPDSSTMPTLSLPCCPCSRDRWVRLGPATLCRKVEPFFLPRFRLPWRTIIEQKCTFPWLRYPGEAVPAAHPEHPHTLLERVPGETLQSCSLSIMPTFCFNIKGSSAVLSVTLIALTSCGCTRHLMSKPIK